jgi:hypothetical protein
VQLLLRDGDMRTIRVNSWYCFDGLLLELGVYVDI